MTDHTPTPPSLVFELRERAFKNPVPHDGILLRLAAEEIERLERALANSATRSTTKAEVRLDSGGEVDEVCAPGGGLERLDGARWFLELGDVALWLGPCRSGFGVTSYERRDPGKWYENEMERLRNIVASSHNTRLELSLQLKQARQIIADYEARARRDDANAEYAEQLHSLVDRALKMMVLSGYAIAPHDADHNNPVVAWMAEARAAIAQRSATGECTTADRQPMAQAPVSPCAEPRVEPLTGEKLALRIRAVLMAHRLQHTLADDESGGHRLVDALTMPFDETIKTGIDEIDILAEEIACHLDDARVEPRLADDALEKMTSRAFNEAGWRNTLARGIRDALAVGQVVGGSKKALSDLLAQHEATRVVSPEENSL